MYKKDQQVVIKTTARDKRLMNGHTCIIKEVLTVKPHHAEKWQAYDYVYLLIWRQQDNPDKACAIRPHIHVWTEDDFYSTPVFIGNLLDSGGLPDI